VAAGTARGGRGAGACGGAGAPGAARGVWADPGPAPPALARLRREADDLLCLSAPRAFAAVGEWYEDFSQTGDDEVRALLAEAEAGGAAT
ncbi:phosphoribosyltransferase, partial [Streptomyces sp. NPDC056224]